MIFTQSLIINLYLHMRPQPTPKDIFGPRLAYGLLVIYDTTG